MESSRGSVDWKEREDRGPMWTLGKDRERNWYLKTMYIEYIL
jgi:hypothetical protein